jgi:hypothetical protein
MNAGLAKCWNLLATGLNPLWLMYFAANEVQAIFGNDLSGTRNRIQARRKWATFTTLQIASEITIGEIQGKFIVAVITGIDIQI